MKNLTSSNTDIERFELAELCDLLRKENPALVQAIMDDPTTFTAGSQRNVRSTRLNHSALSRSLGYTQQRCHKELAALRAKALMLLGEPVPDEPNT